MKRGFFVLVFLLVAACVPPVEEIAYEEQYYQAQVIPEPVVSSRSAAVDAPVVAAAEDERVEVVRKFLENQDSGNIDEYLAGLRKNLELTGGELSKIIAKQVIVYSEQAAYTQEFMDLYEKSKNVLDERRLDLAKKQYDDVYEPRLTMGVWYEDVELSYGGEKDGEVFVKVKAMENSRLPGSYSRQNVDDTYVLKNVDGLWKIFDVIVDGERLTYASMWEQWQVLERQNQVEERSLDSLRMVVGLSTI